MHGQRWAVYLKFNPYLGQGDGVAKWDEFGGAFRAQDGGDARDAQHISLLGVAGFYGGQGVCLHTDAATGDGDAFGFRLVSDIDHVRLAAGIEMGKFAHVNSCDVAVNVRRRRVVLVNIVLVNLVRWVAIIATMKALYPIVFLLCCAPLACANGLPELGDYSATVMSPLDEQRIADEIMKDVYASSQVVEDPEINDYIDDLGHRLAVAGPDKYQRFNFFVVKDNTINAFAMPGGVIGVHTGLLLAARSESEVAGVLGHEIGHVVQRHLARMLAKQKNDSVISMATMALALLAARSNPQLTSGALVASGASAIQKQIDYTREHEREADRVGLQIMADAGFDTRAMPSFFETLQKGTRFSEGSAPAFLRTHPLTVERIADVRNRVEQQTSFRIAQESPDFYFIKARLLADIGTADSAINTFRINLQEKRYASESAEHYGMALAMLRKSDLAGAREQVAWLRRNAIPNALIETLATRVAVAGQPFEVAGQQYLKALGEYPEHRALIYDYANHLLGSRQLDKLLQLIADKLDRFPDDPYLYELRARAYSIKGKSLLMHQAQGEAYARRYNLRGAVEQMDLAARATDGDFYEKSIVEARLSQLRQRLDDKRMR